MRRNHLQRSMTGLLSLAMAIVGLPFATCELALAADADQGKLKAAYGRLELSFEANWGQADPAAKFLARGPGYGMLLTPTEAILALRRVAPIERGKGKMSLRKGQSRDSELALVRVRLAGSDAAARILGEGPGRRRA